MEQAKKKSVRTTCLKLRLKKDAKPCTLRGFEKSEHRLQIYVLLAPWLVEGRRACTNKGRHMTWPRRSVERQKKKQRTTVIFYAMSIRRIIRARQKKENTVRRPSPAYTEHSSVQVAVNIFITVLWESVVHV